MKNIIYPKTWQEALWLALACLDYQKKKNAYDQKPLLRRLVVLALGRVPRNPAPGMTAEGYALRYTQLFNEKHKIGRRRDFDGASSVFLGLRYSSEDLMPVLSFTFMECGTGYSLRAKFHRDGHIEYLPCPYPDSEVCFTINNINDMPKREGHSLLFEEYARMKEIAVSAMSDIASNILKFD